MKELFTKLIEAGKTEAFEGLDSLKKAAAELGYTEAQIDEALKSFSGFPLDDDDLAEIAGGYPRPSSLDPPPERYPGGKHYYGI